MTAKAIQRISLATTWFARLLTGGVFSLSGLTKGIDPWGTLYKFQDYVAAIGLDIWPELLLTGVFALCVLEFLTGIFILFGCFRRSAPVMAALFMVVMLPLTLWIAIWNPVADCGCFGDAFVISNWGTFWKNVILSAAVIWLLKYNRQARALVNPYVQWIAAVASSLFIIGVSAFGYLVQPMIDFRPYSTGTPLVDNEQSEQDDTDADELAAMVFVYSKDGIEREFRSTDSLPDEDDGWQFVERRSVVPESHEYSSASHSTDSSRIRIWSRDGEEDLSEDVVGDGQQLILMVPQLSKVSAATTWQINSLYEWCTLHDVDMFAVVSGNSEEIDRWQDISLAEYPIYTADDTAIKEVVRGNPGVVYVENDTIMWKSSLKALDTDDFLAADNTGTPRDFGYDYRDVFIRAILLFMTVMLVLVILSYSPSAVRLFRTRTRHKTADQNDNQQNLK